MFYVLLACTCVPGGLSRAAWAPSPGPQGRLPGGVFDQLSESQTLPSPLGFRIKIYVDFDVGFGSLWGRSGVPLGSHFRSFWRLGRPKLVPEPSSNRLIFEKVILCEKVRFPILLGPSGSRMAPPKRPRSLQDGSLILLDRFCSLLDFRFDFGSF